MSGEEIRPLVTPMWLADHLDDPDLVVLDVRVELTSAGAIGARSAYENGHVPGAVFADLANDLCDPSASIAFALPTPEAFCAAVGQLGVGDDTRVVLYDGRITLPGLAASSIWAARAWWMLRWVGFDRAALLDGGYQAWVDAGLPSRTGDELRPARQLTPRPRPHLVADRDEVRAAMTDDGVTIVDTLDADHFAGRRSMYSRPGHITSAINRPVFDLYDASGCFLAVDEIATRCADLPPGRIITSCGGGIAASAAAFAMTLAGHDDVAVYTASLQEWAADPTNPMDVGDS